MESSKKRKEICLGASHNSICKKICNLKSKICTAGCQHENPILRQLVANSWPLDLGFQIAVTRDVEEGNEDIDADDEWVDNDDNIFGNTKNPLCNPYKDLRVEDVHKKLAGSSFIKARFLPLDDVKGELKTGK